ncbi:hypothetical protein V8C86DRAFT_2816894 [Haematococcus lacustris]
MDAKLAVEEANGAFYAAFSSGNLQAMNEIWGFGDHIQVIHPLASTIAGREAVINADDSQGRITATNIFEKQDGKWKITLHHGSEAPIAQEA